MGASCSEPYRGVGVLCVTFIGEACPVGDLQWSQRPLQEMHSGWQSAVENLQWADAPVLAGVMR